MRYAIMKRRQVEEPVARLVWLGLNMPSSSNCRYAPHALCFFTCFLIGFAGSIYLLSPFPCLQFFIRMSCGQIHVSAAWRLRATCAAVATMRIAIQLQL